MDSSEEAFRTCLVQRELRNSLWMNCMKYEGRMESVRMDWVGWEVRNEISVQITETSCRVLVFLRITCY